MHAFLDRLATPVRRAPALVVIAVIVVTAVLGGFASTAKQEPGGFEEFASGTPAAAASDEITARFGDAGARQVAQLAVVDEGGDVLSPEGIAVAQRISGALLQDPAVAAVADPPAPDRPFVSSWADPVLGAAAAQGIDPTTVDDATVDALYDAAVGQLPPTQAAQVSVLLGGQVDGADATAGMILVFLDGNADPAALAAARDAINAQAGTLDSGVEVYSFDFEALSEQVNDEIQSQLSLLLLVAFALIILILVAIYRSVADVLISLVGLVFSIVWMQGVGVLLGPDHLGWTGGMSQMTMAIPILLVGLGVDYGIHLTMRAREEKAKGQDAAHAAAGAIRAVGAALALATMTTVVGFLTNLSNPLPPLKDFGVVAAVGVVAAFVVMTTFVPAARLLVDRRRERKGKAITTVSDPDEHVSALGRLSSAFAPIAVHHPMRVVVVAAIVTAIAGAGATQLSTEFSQTDFFPSGSRALETVQVVQDAFGGSVNETTSVLVQGDVVGASGLRAIAAYQQDLAGVDGVRTFQGQAQVDSVVSRLAQAGMLDQALGSDAAAAEAVAALRSADPGLSGVLTPAGDAAVLRISTSAGEDAPQLADRLDAVAANTLVPAGLEQQPTSEELVIHEILGQLQASQVRGLLITLLASMLILAIAFWFRDRAPMLGVLAIASVGVTTAWVFGLMALFGIPFNVMTAMVSALAIGIGVPFGIHVVNRFLEDRTHYGALDEAMRKTLAHTGGAIVGSALTTVAGFGVLVFSSVPPMRQFGLVTAITIGLALVASLTVLPALLTLWARRRDGRPAPSDPAPTEDPVTVS